jgi:hypothetical protein
VCSSDLAGRDFLKGIIGFLADGGCAAICFSVISRRNSDEKFFFYNVIRFIASFCAGSMLQIELNIIVLE